MGVTQGEEEDERGPVDGLGNVRDVGPVHHRSIRVTQRERSLSGGMVGNELLAMLRSARQDTPRCWLVAQPQVMAQSMSSRKAYRLVIAGNQ